MSMKTQKKDILNICTGVPNWNVCTWRDENTIISKDGKHILCNSQCAHHKCERLLKINTQQQINID